MQYLKEVVTTQFCCHHILMSPYSRCHHFLVSTIFRFQHFSMTGVDSRADHEKLCVHIRNMHRYLHRVRKEIDNELAKTYRISEPLRFSFRQVISDESYDMTHIENGKFLALK